MKTHELKCWCQPFDLVAVGLKTYEVRVDDREYAVGDTVILRRFEPHIGPRGIYTGARVTARIGAITRDSFGLPRGLCVFSLLDLKVTTA